MEIPLTSLSTSRAAVIKRFIGGPHFQNKLRLIGIREGKKIKLLASQPLRGPVVIETDRMSVTIGRRMAQNIIVEVD